MMPKIELYPATNDKNSRDTAMIGKSVISGENATFIPSPCPCFRV